MSQPYDQCVAIRGIGGRNSLTDQPGFAHRLFNAAVDDAASIGVEIEKSAAEQHQGYNVDRKNAPGE